MPGKPKKSGLPFQETAFFYFLTDLPAVSFYAVSGRNPLARAGVFSGAGSDLLPTHV
ncbi:MAG: hypothetical protein ACSW75_00280 [Lachnospiraceae bacterium]